VSTVKSIECGASVRDKRIRYDTVPMHGDAALPRRTSSEERATGRATAAPSAAPPARAPTTLYRHQQRPITCVRGFQRLCFESTATDGRFGAQDRNGDFAPALRKHWCRPHTLNKKRLLQLREQYRHIFNWVSDMAHDMPNRVNQLQFSGWPPVHARLRSLPWRPRAFRLPATRPNRKKGSHLFLSCLSKSTSRREKRTVCLVVGGLGASCTGRGPRRGPRRSPPWRRGRRDTLVEPFSFRGVSGRFSYVD